MRNAAQQVAMLDVPDFVHRHLLRAAVNSTWGDQIIHH